MKELATNVSRPIKWVMCALFLVLPVFAVYASKGMTILLIAGAITVLFDPFLRQATFRSSLRWHLITFSPLLVYVLATSPFAVDPVYSLVMVGRLFALLVASMILWRALGALAFADRRQLLLCALGGGTLLLALVGLELATDLAFMRWLKHLKRGPGQNDYITYINNGVALLSLLAPVFSLCARRFKSSLTIFIFMGLTLLALYLGNASTPILGFFLAVASILAAFTLGRWASRLLGVALVAGVLAMPFAFEGYLSVRGGLQGLEDSLRWSSLHRLYVWTFALDRWHEKPMLGWGLDSSRDIPGGRESLPGFVGVEFMPLHPHNGALQVWLELGFFGTLTYVFVLWRLTQAMAGATENRNVLAARMSLLGGYAAQGMLSFGLWQNWWLASLALGAVLTNLIGKDEAPHE
ncbi:MAG: O-antigen ligase family protein [Alphaproteobacteria bacterium]|nr:O-antigen ligase family protein [Alphaproteobacteria bacterium]